MGYFQDQFQTLCSFISPLSCTSVAQLWFWFSLKFGFSFSFVRLITGLQNNLLGWQLLMKQPEQSCPQHSLSQFSNLDQQHKFLAKKRKSKPFCLSFGYLQTRAHQALNKSECVLCRQYLGLLWIHLFFLFCPESFGRIPIFCNCVLFGEHLWNVVFD